MTDRASGLDVLRARGYAIRTIPSPFTTTSLTSADDFADPGFLTQFEVRLIRASPWSALLRDQVREYLAGQVNNQLRHTLHATAAMAEDREQEPQFVFSHVLGPHTPFVLTDGRAAPAEKSYSCFPMVCSLWSSTIQELQLSKETYGAGLERQLGALNAAILASVERIVAADPTAVIVLFSDHGSRYSLADPEEHFRSFVAVRSPGHPRLFPADVSPVNLLRGLYSTYFDAPIPQLEYRAWISDWASYLRLEPYAGSRD